MGRGGHVQGMTDSEQGGLLGRGGHLQGTEEWEGVDTRDGGMGRCGHVQGTTDSEQGGLLGRGGHVQGTEEWEGDGHVQGTDRQWTRRNGKGWTCTRDNKQWTRDDRHAHNCNFC